jgi:hypothetical protein
MQALILRGYPLALNEGVVRVKLCAHGYIWLLATEWGLVKAWSKHLAAKQRGLVKAWSMPGVRFMHEFLSLACSISSQLTVWHWWKAPAVLEFLGSCLGIVCC